MPFCTSCGSQVNGQFCEKCGARVGATAAAPPPPQPAMRPAAPAAPAAVARKTSPIVWVLIGIGVVILLIVGLITVGAFVAMHKLKQAGLDPALWEKNPGVAAAKMLAAANPDAEVLSVDENAGVVVIREKSTGKTVKLNFADLKQGRITAESEGQKVSISGQGEGVEVKSAEGTAKFAAGSSVKLPSWLPAYSGAKDAGGLTSSGANGEAGSYGFKTSDSPAAVIQFYDSALKKAGFKILQTMNTPEMTTLSAKNDQNMGVKIDATPDTGQTSVTISFGKE